MSNMSFTSDFVPIERHDTIHVRGVREVTIENLTIPMAPFYAIYNPRRAMPPSNASNYEARVRIYRFCSVDGRLHQVHEDMIVRGQAAGAGAWFRVRFYFQPWFTLARGEYVMRVWVRVNGVPQARIETERFSVVAGAEDQPVMTLGNGDWGMQTSLALWHSEVRVIHERWETVIG